MCNAALQLFIFIYFENVSNTSNFIYNKPEFAENVSLVTNNNKKNKH